MEGSGTKAAGRTLAELRNELCASREVFCQRCFVGQTTQAQQCPPNVFRAEGVDAQKPIAFIFDKPNDNTPFRDSPLVPITIFDDRAGVDRRLPRAPSHSMLLLLCRRLGIIHADTVVSTRASCTSPTR
jgi:hypothetical protein